MKHWSYILSFIGILLLGVINGVSQTYKEPDILKSDIEPVLPSLGNLIDSAIAHNPTVRYRDLQIIVNKCQYKANRTQWLKNLGIQADVRNGTFNNFSTSTSEGQNPDLLASRSNQTNYGVGLS